MEEKQEKLMECIRNNPNLTNELKENIKTLTDLVVSIFPDCDYSNLEEVLSSFSIKDEGLESYSKVDFDSKTISLDLNQVSANMLDVQHLVLNSLLMLGSQTNGLGALNVGLTELISSSALMNSDDSMVRQNLEEYTLASVFSKIVDPSVIASAYFSNGPADIVVALESVGISSHEFEVLTDCFNGLKSDPNAFTDAEVLMTHMFGELTNHQLSNNVITSEEAQAKYDDFSSLLIMGRSDLESIYSHYDLSYMTGFDNVRMELAKGIENINKVPTLDSNIK